MALRTAGQWNVWLNDLDLTNDEKTNYSTILENQAITEDDLPSFDHELLRSCKIEKYGHRTRIIRKARGATTQTTSVLNSYATSSKACAIPRPTVQRGVNQLEFQQFVQEWKQFRKHYNLSSPDEVDTQLTFCCSKDVRAKLLEIKTPNIVYAEDNLLQLIEEVCLSKVSRMSHIKQFFLLKQDDGESCDEYFSRLQTLASCCKFKCEHCGKSTSKSRVREKFVLGLKDKHLQTAILRTETHQPQTTLEKLLEEATTLEQSVREQGIISQRDNAVAESSIVHKISSNDNERFESSGEDSEMLTANLMKFRRKSSNVNQSYKKGFPQCPRCGTFTHAVYTTSERCPAWGKACNNCGGKNHFSKMCRQSNKKRNGKEKQGSAQHIELSCLSVGGSKSSFIRVNVQNTVNCVKGTFVSMEAFPDTGANLCLFGTRQLKELGMQVTDLNKCRVSVKVAGGSNILATGKCKLIIALGKRQSQTFAYFCKKADRFYIKQESCKDLGIIPLSFPYPSDFSPEMSMVSLLENERVLPKPPTVLPFAPNEQNIGKLKQYLIDNFSSTTFNKSTPFPKLSTPPARIHLRPDFRIPKPAYWPASVAEHWSEQVRLSIERDVAAGILKKVPFNEPTVWCSRMVVVKKKDGRPRRTVDFQRLNAECMREPNHQESPFNTARKVPQNTWKTVVDAVDGYHSVAIDEESSKLTTFITPWGRYRYLRFPQGHCAAGDAFNGRIQLILSDVPRMVRIVDDICLYDSTIEESFWHTWNLLMLCAHHGIVLNKTKFQFCLKNVEFAGLSITSEGIQPSNKIISAIENYPPPNDLTKARAFFGLVNQVNWAYANSQAMTPFRSLVKPGTVFCWNATLEGLFESCKRKILQQVRNGVVKYDLERYTCIQTDYSKDGLGYLLLQKYCNCSLDQAPLCCKDGWKLVFAGSRFTKGPESRYAPTEGEALAIAWSLNHARLFTLGCPRLIISTDHKPLLGILNNKPLEEIKNPRILRLKEQTLPYTFTVKYNRGKWHRGPDALSRSPQESTVSEIFMIFGDSGELQVEEKDCTAECAIASLDHTTSSISLEDLRNATSTNGEMCALISTIQNGFPSSHQATDFRIRQFFPVRNELWIKDGLVMFKDRLVIPTTLRERILALLHSAHQGVEGMRSRAADCVYWPGLNSSIREKRKKCSICENIAPSQNREPLKLIGPAEYPFQQICMDAFEIKGKYYSVIVDRFSNWFIVFCYKSPPQAKHFIQSLRSVFSSYGAPNKLFSDGGLQFQSTEMKTFLQGWSIMHVISSASYPQANGRAELAVKTAKRLLQNNTAPDGSLNCNAASHALLQYRNTPIKHLGLSPSQILFHRNLKDGIPTNPMKLKPHRRWISAAYQREKAFEQRDRDMVQRYNVGTRTLSVIPIGSSVVVQDTSSGVSRNRWNRSGTVVEQTDRKYTIRMHGSGRVITRNRKHIKVQTAPTDCDSSIIHIPSTSSSENNTSTTSLPNEYVPATSFNQSTSSLSNQATFPVSSDDAVPDYNDSVSVPHNDVRAPVPKTPRMVKRLRPHNKPGRVEETS